MLARLKELISLIYLGQLIDMILKTWNPFFFALFAMFLSPFYPIEMFKQGYIGCSSKLLFTQKILVASL